MMGDDIREESINAQCFVIMPISDPKEYEVGHFRCVYEDIFTPAIEAAGYIPKRADDDKSSSMIQVGIIRDIVESPMAICDLSSRNPNVLFELGIRQAFDLPVVLVQEEGTPRIFDISTINTIDYSKALLYRNVMKDRENIKNAIMQTRDNTKGINSIVKLLDRGPAQKTESIGEDALLFTMSNQIQNIINRMDSWYGKTGANDERQQWSFKVDPTLFTEQPRSKREIMEQDIEKLQDRYENVSRLEDIEDLVNELKLMRSRIAVTSVFDPVERISRTAMMDTMIMELCKRIEE